MSSIPTPGRREASHERIVEAAARALRSQGYAGVGVAGVMAEAGLTHGGFYAHFASREALLAAALERAGKGSADAMSGRVGQRRAGTSAFRAVVESYLSERHLGSPESGCVVAALASEMPRQGSALRAASQKRVRGLVGLVAQSLPAGVPEAEAGVIAASLVGTLQLARTFGANAEGKALLAATRRSLLGRYDSTSS